MRARLFVFSFAFYWHRSPRIVRAQISPTWFSSTARVWTENPQQPEAEAVAILGNRIAAVGTSADILKLAGPATKVIDLGGKRVVPGFNDAHVHFVSGGTSLASVQLGDTKSEAEFRQRIADYAKSQPKGTWILEGEWDHERWSPARLPTHQLIDDVTPDNPVFVSRLDGHEALANALAMKLAGVDKNTKDVPGGVIVRDAEGNPTGIFKDAAQGLIEKVIPPANRQQLIAAVEAAEKYAAENGVTSVQDMSAAPDTLRVYETLYREGKLQVRISGRQPLPLWKRLAGPGIQANFGNDTLHIGGLKGFADGSLGSTTAWFFKPYLDAPNTSGIPSDELSKPDEMYANIRDADKAGLQVAIHAIGDRANNTILNFYERVEKENGPWSDGLERRFRIEHAQHLLPTDIPRFASLHVIASMQPYHCIDDGRWAAKRIDAERIKTTYAFRSLLDSRSGTRLRLRLAGRPDGAADGHLCRRDPPHARRQEPRTAGSPSKRSPSPKPSTPIRLARLTRKAKRRSKARSRPANWPTLSFSLKTSFTSTRWRSGTPG